MTLKDKLGEVGYSDALKSSFVYVGDTSRIFDALHKTEINIMYLGGSVTIGFSYDGLNSGAFPEYLDDRIREITGSAVSSTNYGACGSNPLIGEFMYLNDPDGYDADLFFIEYSINDEKTPKGIERFESLVRRLLSDGKAVAIITLVNANGYNCEEFQLPIAKYYSVPVISVGSFLLGLFSDGRACWGDYGSDELHPHDNGHRIITDCVSSFLERAYHGERCEAASVPPAAFFSTPYCKMKLNNDIAARGFSQGACTADGIGYSLRSDTLQGIHEISFNVTAACIVIMYIIADDSSYGSADVVLDGVTVGTLNAYSIFGWNNPICFEAVCEKEKRPHSIIIRMRKGDEQKKFELVAIGVS